MVYSHQASMKVKAALLVGGYCWFYTKRRKEIIRLRLDLYHPDQNSKQFNMSITLLVLLQTVTIILNCNSSNTPPTQGEFTFLMNCCNVNETKNCINIYSKWCLAEGFLQIPTFKSLSGMSRYPWIASDHISSRSCEIAFKLPPTPEWTFSRPCRIGQCKS